jgi:hypothetical protein
MTLLVRDDTISLLDQAVERVRPILSGSGLSTKQRVRLLWAAVKMASGLAAADVVEETFIKLAVEVKLIDEQGRWTGADIAEHRIRHGADDVAHVVRWALRGWNPFESGPLT